MYIDGEFETNNDVEKGTEAHEKAAQRSDRIDVMEDIPEFESPPRNLIFYSEELMLSGALDAIKQRNGEWIPFEAIHHGEVRGNLPLRADTQVETVVNILELIRRSGL